MPRHGRRVQPQESHSIVLRERELVTNHPALLVGTDGLFKYAHPEEICRLARLPALGDAIRRLADCPRLHSGALPDDIGIVLCRATAMRAKYPGSE